MDRDKQQILWQLSNHGHRLDETERIILVLSLYQIPINRIAKRLNMQPMVVKKILSDALSKLW